ncbi:hypothetical protein BZL35_00803 [Candidatus Pandoraea novymonadis]|uniref:Uncharacterized protein n=1 Tax=Candidatus Pandoraea novymonadis TaxID=1808959 RepID=A0ABX5FDB6_9BURK|nr:hypothetical protein BZL35_00803 [Candidatus Pandoraea novymonadis]
MHCALHFIRFIVVDHLKDLARIVVLTCIFYITILEGHLQIPRPKMAASLLLFLQFQ